MTRKPLATAIAVLTLAGCATTPYANQHRDPYDQRASSDRGYVDERNRYDNDYDYGDARYARAECRDCGTIERIERYNGDGRASGLGAVAGAVVGGVLGNQVGGGSGKTAATVVGAVAGGVAGNAIEKNRREGSVYALGIRMDDGRRLTVERRELDGLRSGDRVRVRDGRIVSR